MIILFLLALPALGKEDDLLKRANRGDQTAVIEIYDLYFHPVYRFVRNRVDDPQQAEDICSTIFLKLMQALGGPNAPRKSLRGWLFQVTRNELKQQFRTKQRHKITELEEWIPDPAQANPETVIAQLMDRERVQQVFKILAPDQQEVLLLRFAEMLNLEETAQAMQKSVSAVKSLQFRAVQTLRNLLMVSEEPQNV